MGLNWLNKGLTRNKIHTHYKYYIYEMQRQTDYKGFT